MGKISNIYSSDEACGRMNRLAAQGRSFVFVVSYAGDEALVMPADEVNPDECLYSFNGFTNAPAPSPADNSPVSWRFTPPTIDDYRRSFDLVQAEINAGNSYLANLTVRAEVETSLTLRQIFMRTKAPYRLWLKDQLVCFSPEIFIRMAHGRISSYPMKGTIDATLPDAEKQLMDNAKEAAEHATIVDLIRNDLSQVADRVNVKRYRYVDRLQTNRGTLLQTSSEIEGRLLDGFRHRPGDVLFAQLPAGSITGAPKRKTCSIIAEAENYDRGFYTGVMGCWHDGMLDSGVMIRFIDNDNGRLYFKAGGGITAQSNLEDEYNEVIQKIYVPIF